MWGAHDPSPVGQPMSGHDGCIYSVAYSPPGNLIASGCGDKTIRLWDVNTRRQLGDPIKGDHIFYSVAFSPDAKLIAAGCGGYLSSQPSAHSVQLWDVQRMTTVSNPFKGHSFYVNSVQFSPDGTRVVSGSHDMTIRVWDVEHGTTSIGPFQGHTAVVRSTAFSPDGTQIVSGSYDYTLRLWDVRSGRLIGNPYIGHTDSVYSVAFSPRGTHIVSGGVDNTVRVWDVRTGRQVEQPFEEHTNAVLSVAFSPCGEYVASGSADRKVITRSILASNLELTYLSGTHIINRQTSTHQVFECLTSTGCIDLSSQLDPIQENAMIVSGGGFGDIWMGKLHNGGRVAIKTRRTNTLGHCNYATLKRAARELFCWSRMEHPNIHRLQGVIMFRGQSLGMVSEWMDNGNLHEYLGNYPGANRYQLCIHVASGLKYMHSCGTRGPKTFRLKAVNVLVSSDGVARLSDFDYSIISEVGSLVFSESSNSRSGSIRWTAPEIVLAEVPTKRTTHSDVYALGMTLLEIFTGEVPYPTCRRDYQLFTTVQSGILPIRPLKLLKNDRQGDMMWQLLLRCWARGPSERPSSEQVLDALVTRILARSLPPLNETRGNAKVLYLLITVWVCFITSTSILLVWA
ncbi:tyrosine kinase family catalytic domain protein [Rhizoctonia solani AG-3 Rhs1AP]|nr:tyrosine kinase family catalytic domain protein [Rhizoctonia solani AG-3 Rhs1AP]